MAQTKTDRLIAALIADGYTPQDTKSSRTCYAKLKQTKNHGMQKHYVWVLTGTLRGGFDSRYGEAIALPNTCKRLLGE